MILVIIEQIATRQQQVNLLSIRIKIIGSASADKYLSNFWRSLDLPLSNCEIELDLSWSRNCILSEISRTPGVC